MASKNKPKALPQLDDIKEAMQMAIVEHLGSATSASGNEYFTVPDRQIPMTVGAVTGMFSCSWFNLKDASAVAVAEAATIEQLRAKLRVLEARQNGNADSIGD
jgi:hypothetical protein